MMNTPLHFLDGSVPFVYDGRDRMVLPKQFTPGDDVVIIGRGKKVQQHPANIRFRALIQSQLAAYSNAATKGLKSNILWRVLHEVRGYSTSRLGFVKRDTETGRWYAIDDASAKINISQAFRDGLHSDYKSSKKRKQLKRKAEMGESTTANTTNEQQHQYQYQYQYQYQQQQQQQETQLEHNIFAALNRFETKLERSPQSPNKRLCVATNEKALEARDPSDHTLGRLGSTMDRLRNFLASPPSVSIEPQGNQLNLNLKLNSNKRNDSWDTFTGLYKKFGSFSQFSDDPFEPKPIASSMKDAAFGSDGNNGEIAFPHFAMSAMVDETNPPEAAVLAAASAGSKKRSQEFDAASCMKEAMLPSILSLSSLEFSEAGTLTGMTSISSLSTISDCQELHEAWERLDSDRSRNSRNSTVLQAS